MRNTLKAVYGRVSNMKPAVARELYNCFVGDASVVETMADSVVNERVQAFLDCEDEDIIWDLRVDNTGRPEKYAVFFEHCQQCRTNQAELAADEWRHDTVVHMGTVVSAASLLKDVNEMCIPGTPIPSAKWL